MVSTASLGLLLRYNFLPQFSMADWLNPENIRDLHVSSKPNQYIYVKFWNEITCSPLFPVELVFQMAVAELHVQCYKRLYSMLHSGGYLIVDGSTDWKNVTSKFAKHEKSDLHSILLWSSLIYRWCWRHVQLTSCHRKANESRGPIEDIVHCAFFGMTRSCKIQALNCNTLWADKVLHQSVCPPPHFQIAGTLHCISLISVTLQETKVL